jgi:uncharacterized protein YbbK (DUF523 family)
MRDPVAGRAIERPARAPAGKPRVGVSACLLGVRVRYDGGHRREQWLVDVLGPHVQWVPVCPEVEMGLDVPRPTIELRRAGGAVRLMEPASGRDLTAAMDGWAATAVGELACASLDGFVLKARSPSCGAWHVAVRGPRGAVRHAGRGRFAAALLAALPRLAVEEEEAFGDPARRVAFCERLFASRRLRDLWSARWRVADLRAFHARHAWQLMAHDPARARALDRLCAEATDAARGRMQLLYIHGFTTALTRPATAARVAAVHRRAGRLLGTPEDVGRRSSAAARRVLRRLAAGTPWAGQTWLAPVPAALER